MDELQNLVSTWRAKAERLKSQACQSATSRSMTGLLNEAWGIEDCAAELAKALEAANRAEVQLCSQSGS